MPTYEYKCPAGHLFEKFFPTMHDKRREKCPVCGRQAERQISGGAGLVFKGSGFYITDYKRAGEKQPEGNEEPKPLPESKPTVESKTPEGTKSKKKKTDSGDKRGCTRRSARRWRMPRRGWERPSWRRTLSSSVPAIRRTATSRRTSRWCSPRA